MDGYAGYAELYRSGRSAAIVYTLIETAELNGGAPQVWLTGVLTRIANHRINKVDELPPWHYAQN